LAVTFCLAAGAAAIAADGPPGVDPFFGRRAPSITKQPQSSTNLIGSSARFEVTAVGRPPLGYQWFFNGKAIADATTNTLSLATVQNSHAGKYQVEIANETGRATSEVAMLVVTAAETFPITNLFKVQGITFRGKASSAIINGKSVKVGDTIDGAVVSAIEQNSVKLKYRGAEHTLKF
jgi:hypothetical protein